MGTRNLTCVVKDGNFKVAQYCQWDGYPDGQGATIADFICGLVRDDKLGQFRNQIDKVKAVDDEYVKKCWAEVGVTTDMVTLDKSAEFKIKYPQFHRDLGAGVLEYILKTESPIVFLDIDFAGNSLFCEWCYVIDLDNNVLEIYKGFNKKPLNKSDRFWLSNLENKTKNEQDYYPVKLYHKVSFIDINKETMPDLQKKYIGEE